MADFGPLLDAVADRCRPPLAVVLGGTRLVADLLFPLLDKLGGGPVVCYQMDAYQAGRLREELAEAGFPAEVRVAADLWDLPAEFKTVVYPAAAKGERELKIDLAEQAYQVLQPHGQLLTLSPHESDSLFPKLLKKLYGKVSMFGVRGAGTAFACVRPAEDRPRRRHELTFHAKLGPEGESLTFLTRQGVFSYGKFDDGSRALAESMEIQPGDRVLDVGCGAGEVGVFAGRAAGDGGHVTFLDSNARAVALAELNAKAAGLPSFDTVLAADAAGVPAGSYDVALANPPYFAGGSIARRFVAAGHAALKPGGRLLVVTKQPNDVEPALGQFFGEAARWERRGYTVFEVEREGRLRPGPDRGARP